MADGDAQFRELTRRLHALGPEMTRAAVGDIAGSVKRRIGEQLERGTTPDGRPWTPRKDGSRALPNAKDAVRVDPVTGSLSAVVVTVEGGEALHHRGDVHGNVVRQVLPGQGEVPASIEQAVREVLDERFVRAVGGAR